MSITIVFQGDSITDCGRLTCGGAGYDNKGLGPGYPGMIASRLLCDMPEKDWTFYNLGISGNRVVDLYARWKLDALNLKPDVISILIGVNDTWHEFSRENGVEVPRYERIYRELLTWSRQVLPNVKFVLMDPYVCTDPLQMPFPDQNTADFAADVAARAEVVERLAKEFNAIHIPLQKLMTEACKRAPQAYWTADGVHPTPAFHQIITDEWIKATKHLF